MNEPTITKEPTDRVLTCYRVTLGRKLLGFVWKRRGFSYYGMQGWNAGIRIRDFHPIEWHYGAVIGTSETYGRRTRRRTIEALVEERKKKR